MPFHELRLHQLSWYTRYPRPPSPLIEEEPEALTARPRSQGTYTAEPERKLACSATRYSETLTARQSLTGLEPRLGRLWTWN